MNLYSPRILKHLIVSILAVFLCLKATAGFCMTVGFMVGSGGLGDESFNDMTWKGLGKAGEECSFRLISHEWQKGSTKKLELEKMIQQGAEVIIFNGDEFLPLIQSFVPKHPDIWFIANDFDGGQAPNLKSIIYSQHEGAFLAGALAALQSQTGKVGFIGAVDIPVIKAFEIGFTEGVHHISADTVPTIEYISTLPDYTGFSNPGKAYQKATVLYTEGVDIIFAVAGMSGNGIIQAAKAQKEFVIGVDADQDHMAPGHVLTSVMKRLDHTVYIEVKKACKGELTPGMSRYGIKNGGISLTPMKYTFDIIGTENRRILEELRQKIISGEIVVTDFLQGSD